MRRGYLSPPLLIILAVITLVVAFVIYFNTNLIKQSKTQQAPSADQLPSDVVNPSVAPLPKLINTPSNQSTTWKSYSNQEWQFSLMYPSNWRVYEQLRASNPQLNLILEKENSRITAIAFPVNEDFERFFSCNQGETKEVTIDGVKTLSCNSTGGIYLQQFSNDGQFGYGLELRDQSRKELKVFDQILSTFKFLD